ncbi:MAG: Lrp/AsnC family transcriptional regulator [Thaumarchaeota archaeon]|nr:Lrp/AsnC family transcriptional regulator [Nitrososphaerota archaeon]
MSTSGKRLLDKRPARGLARGLKSGRLAFDQLDLKIVRSLMANARVSFRELAVELDVSPTTVIARVSKLQDDGVIRGYMANIDFEKLGYELTAVTEILVSKGKLLEMEREIAKLPGVCAVYDVTGEIDGIVVVKFKDREELSRFTKGLLTMPFVERANTHLVLTTVREDFRVAV